MNECFERELAFVRGTLVNQILSFLKTHHGFEHVIKSGSLLTRKYVMFFLNKLEFNNEARDTKEFVMNDPSCYRLSDLKCLYSHDIEQCFFELCFNLKIDKRNRAFTKILTRIIKDGDGKNISSISIREFLYPIMEFFIFNYWAETIKPATNSTRAKIDQVRVLVKHITDLYADLSRFLTFPQYLTLLKSKISKLKTQSHNEQTYVKLISSILSKIDPNLPDIVKIAKVE